MANPAKLGAGVCPFIFALRTADCPEAEIIGECLAQGKGAISVVA